jgi:ribonuclease HIII
MVGSLVKNEQKSSVPILIKLCSEKTSFEVQMQQRISFNMDEVKLLFQAKGSYEITVHTPYIVVLKNKKGTEITLSKNGRMLIKGVSGEEEAKAVAQEVLRTASNASINSS